MEPRFQGEGVVPVEYVLISTKLDILLSDSANCTVLRTVLLTQFRRVTDGIAVASTARRNARIASAVKIIQDTSLKIQ